MNNFIILKDAFSSGQISSKIWLCEELENINWQSNVTQIYGGWYGILAFLLLSRQRYKVEKIQSFDVDPSCESIADLINENWVWQNWKFKAFTKDCNSIVDSFGDVIINTSTEHFDSLDWFDRIPKGTRLVLQGNNMKHDDHVVHTETLQDFITRYPLSEVNYQGSLDFVYPSWNFTRFMTIGKK
jgi:hypothetical protein